MKAEEKSLKDLEKKLNLNKKRKTLPQGFLTDGLDYLLEVVDEKSNIDYEKEKPDWLTESDEEEILPGGKTIDDEDSEIDDSGEGEDMIEEPFSDTEEEDESMEESMDNGISSMDESDSDDSESDSDENEINNKPLKSILKKKKRPKWGEKKQLTWNTVLEEVFPKKKTKVKGKVEKNKGGKKLNFMIEDDDFEIENDRPKKTKKLARENETFDSDSDSELLRKISKKRKLKVVVENNKGKKKLKLISVDDELEDVSTPPNKKKKLKVTSVNDELEDVSTPPNKKKKKAKVEVGNSKEELEDISTPPNKKKKKTKVEVGNSESESEEELTEDIYGRVRNSRGDVLSEKRDTPAKRGGGGAYVPPAKRAMMIEESEGRKQILEKLKKQMKGLINRVSEANVQSITNQVEELYLSNSRADVNHTLTEIIMAACISSTLTSERFCQELVLLVAVLHNNVGMEVGAYFLQSVAKDYDQVMMESNYGNGKTMENILMLITTLYNFQVIHCSLVFDIIKKCLETFTERDIELLLFIVKNVGFTLRKDDPLKLKDVIQCMQSKAAEVEKSGLVEKSRVMFMLDTILAIKNNNIRKIPNYDPTRTEHLKKLLRTFTKGSHLSSNQLCINLGDLLQAEEKGKWWLVGSAWSGRDTTAQNITGTTEGVTKALSEANAALLELAVKQRMNTDTRKSIFLILMTSEDFVDAFDKLLGLGLKHHQEREIIHVIMSCCIREKTYNPYYAYLIQKFCQFDRRFQMTLQFYMWDKFKEMSNLSSENVVNLVNLVCHQLAQQAVTLSLLKVIEFGTLDKPMVNFLHLLLEQFLLDNPQEVIESVFLKVSVNDKLNHLREGLKLFLVHFILRKKGKDKNNETLTQKVEIAKKALGEGQRNMLL